MSKLNKEFFGKDNFTSRRTTGHNLYDPESLITGAEVEAGFTYENSERKFPSDGLLEEFAIRGAMPTADILLIGPRRFKSAQYSGD